MKAEEVWIGGSYSGFISVWLLAVDWSSLTLDLLLITELYYLHIHPPVRTAGSPRVREKWPCRVCSESSVERARSHKRKQCL